MIFDIWCDIWYMILGISQASAVDSQRITKIYMFHSANKGVNQIDSELKVNMTKRCGFLLINYVVKMILSPGFQNQI